MQLFTHLLSSYLQGMGDFFSALPKRRELLLAVFDVVRGAPSPWGRLGWGFRLTGMGLSVDWDGVPLTLIYLVHR